MILTCSCLCLQHHLKKLEGRRLDFDYKKKRQGKIPDEEIRQAVEKFEESKELAERSMFNFLENDVSKSGTSTLKKITYKWSCIFIALFQSADRSKRFTIHATFTHSQTHSYTDDRGCHARCQLLIRSNLGFSILLKDT